MDNKTLLILGGFGLLIAGGFYLYTQSQAKTAAAAPMYYPPAGQTNVTPSTPDNTARDWEIGIKVAEATVNTVTSLIDQFGDF